MLEIKIADRSGEIASPTFAIALSVPFLRCANVFTAVIAKRQNGAYLDPKVVFVTAFRATDSGKAVGVLKWTPELGEARGEIPWAYSAFASF